MLMPLGVLGMFVALVSFLGWPVIIGVVLYLLWRLFIATRK